MERIQGRAIIGVYGLVHKRQNRFVNGNVRKRVWYDADRPVLRTSIFEYYNVAGMSAKNKRPSYRHCPWSLASRGVNGAVESEVVIRLHVPRIEGFRFIKCNLLCTWSQGMSR